ncbi:MAG TPA: Rieske 2Fe-2S domain-containing protein [Ktedonobacterales bacterium]|jgi:nitrite reductase/ring-hydroxylating ferredoxin subunit/uncharacterized membrane protein
MSDSQEQSTAAESTAVAEPPRKPTYQGPMFRRVIERSIDSQNWLEGFGDGTQKFIGWTLRVGGPPMRWLKNLSHGTSLGHPLHPALTDIPVGAWLGTLVLDIIWLATNRSSGTATASNILLIVGLVGAVLSVLSGTIDWNDTYGSERRVGIAHGIVNTIATLVYVVALVLRLTGNQFSGFILSTIGLVILLLGAYLGGEMVFGKGTQVNHTAWQESPEDFVAVAQEAAVGEGKLVRAQANGMPVLLVRLQGTIYAIAATCTHAGGPLDEGTLEGDVVVCPWHGSRFRVRDGEVRGGPATFPQARFETRVRDGQVEVRRA